MKRDVLFITLIILAFACEAIHYNSMLMPLEFCKSFGKFLQVFSTHLFYFTLHARMALRCH